MARYTPDELEQWFWLPTVASIAAPTVANFTAGEEITSAISSVTGFTYSANKVETPDMGNRFTTSTSGRLTAEDSSIEFYMNDDPASIEAIARGLMPRGADGYIARVHPVEGEKAAIAAATKAQIWPVEVMSAPVGTPSPGEVVKWTASFSITERPNEAATIAA